MAQSAVKLKVWDTFTDHGANEGMEQLIAAFEKKHPNIKIERDVQATNDMRPVIQTALASGTGPDVFYYDTGPGFAGVLAKAGLLMPLDEAYKSQNWGHIYPWTKKATTFDGKTYGIANEVEVYGAFYNRDLFAQLGLKPPTTYEEFLEINQKLKQAGKIPVSFGNKDGWPAYHLFSIYANNFAGRDKMESLLYGNASWNDPDIIKAIDAFFVQMNKAGYLNPEANAIAYGDSLNLFSSGQAGMHITGSWAVDRLVSKPPAFNIGWFVVPKPGGGAVQPTGLGSAYFVSSKTQHSKEAIAFLDFLFAKENARIWTEKMRVVLPYDVDRSAFNLPGIFRAVVEAPPAKELGFNIDVATPAQFNTMMKSGFQAVLLGQKTPAQQAADLQAAMEAARATK